MPHLTIEYTNNLPQFDGHAVLRILNKVLVESALFGEHDIKSRAVRLDTFLVGTEPKRDAFVHVRLALLSGRDEHIRQGLAEKLLLALQRAGTWPAETPVQLCVEIQEITREIYAKAYIDAPAG